MEGLLDEFEASGGWIDRSAFALEPVAEQGYGTIAHRDILPGSPLFRVPSSLILSPYTSELRSALNSESWKTLGHGWSPLILTLMWEAARGKESRWAFYLDRLPNTFDTPMFWTDEQLAELKGTDIEKRIGKIEAEEEYQSSILPVLEANRHLFPPDSQHFSLAAFHLHGSRILSRSFMVAKSKLLGPLEVAEGSLSLDGSDSEDEDDPEEAAMVPLADMLNAAYDRDNAHLFDDDDSDLPSRAKSVPHAEGGFTMVSTKHISSREQIFNTYGSPPNSELLRKYGHVDVFPLQPATLELSVELESPQWLFGNPGDEVELEGNYIVHAVAELGLGSEATSSERVDLWLEGGQDDSFYFRLENCVEDSLIAFARLLSNEDDWERYQAKGRLPKPKYDDNVRAVLLHAIDARLNRYAQPDCVEGAALAQNLITDLRIRNAYIVRLGEKRILHLAKRCVQMSSMSQISGDGNTKRRRDERTSDVSNKKQITS